MFVSTPLPRRFVPILLAVLLGAAGPACVASDAATSHASDISLEKTVGKKLERTTATPGTAASAAVAAPTQDPMEALRLRLAAKLGASKASASGNTAVLSVSTRPTASEAHGAAAVDKPTARRRPSGHGSPAPEGEHEVHWSYDGRGQPEAWGSLKAEFAKCSSGTRQSPIDIRDGIRVDLEAIQFDYKPSPFRVIDNGHTVQVNVGPGNGIDVGGRRFELVQFHFHRPSEERINGKQFEMVAHLVHKDLTGRLAVVAVLLDRGSAHALVQNVWNNLPLEKNEEVAARGMMDVAELLPAERSYFTYMGSLTTPPCSEGVLWMVLKNPVPISEQQIGIFAHLYPMNARPVQAAAGRLIKQSN
jgi:carbonic anhydrase